MKSTALLLPLACAAVAAAAPALPKADLPEGHELVLAAAPPLVKHPMMAGLDDRGRLFVADSAGVNQTPAQLEKNPPHRIVLLEDTDGDQVYDKSTVFADKVVFPQGALWHQGSLYVASPPGIWKFTDTDGDGVADQREMIVGGFEYTGNAADVHGPFLHPTNGRLYWCHGRKGHKVVRKDGSLVHEGKAAGIWSCLPDGGDVQWHALGCMDNPVEIDFTADGDMVGVVNLFYNQPRADTLVHWQYGAAYDRPDTLAVIADLPRTRDTMPYVHNYGHVAVSGFTVYRSGALNPAWGGDLFVTFFNTQKLVRTRLVPAGATYTATTHEFLKIHDPNVHLTDVLEDGDGSLLVVDTGGWFRQGCPASLVEKPDLRGAIYRVRRTGAPRVVDPYGRNIAWDRQSPADLAKLATDERWLVRRRAASLRPVAPTAVNGAVLRDTANPKARLHALEAIALARQIEPAARAALLAMLAEPLDSALEHAAMYAALTTRCFDLATLREATAPRALRRLLRILEQTRTDEPSQQAILQAARSQLESPDAELAAGAAALLGRNPRALDVLADELQAKLRQPAVAPRALATLVEITSARLDQPAAQSLVAAMLRHPQETVRQAAWRIIAQQSGSVRAKAWVEPLQDSLQAAARGAGGDLPLLLEALARMADRSFDAALGALVRDAARAPAIRLKALAAAYRAGQQLDAESFGLLLELSRGEGSPAARMEAARLLARANLSPTQVTAVAPLLASTGPVELAELLKLARRKLDVPTARLLAEQLARSPVFGAIEESAIRSAFSSHPAEIYEGILMPAVRAAAEAKEAKRRKLEVLTAAAARGRPEAGRALYATSACVACHQAGGLGQAIGPDLSHIGQIRSPQDLLESILFPSATIARDYETHLVETTDRQTIMGTIQSDTSEALVVVGAGGEKRTLPRRQVVAISPSPTSMMPEGLEQTLSEQQLLDLVAWLGTLR
jgi:putative membrane-bound dehydrogenase-like protein